MNITLYTFNKRENSTAQPTGGTAYTGQIREPCDIVRPTVAFNLGRSTAPAYNYAYIAAFSRYYFIEGWTYSSGIWDATMVVDALASWKTSIGSQSQYILRSSNTYDGGIIDTLYPMQPQPTYVNTAISPWWYGINNPATQGFYCVGVINSDSAARGAVSYYGLTNTQFRNLMNELLSTTTWTGFVDGDSNLTEDVYKSLFNPMQYVASCVWIPGDVANFSSGTATFPMTIGWWDIDTWYYDLNIAAFYRTYSVQLPDHPLSGTRGAYLNASPYTRMTLQLAGFGQITLNPSAYLPNASISPTQRWLYLDTAFDVTNGACGVTVRGTSGPDTYYETQLGVPIQLSQVTQNFVGSAVNLIGGISGAVGSALVGNVGGAISSAVSGIASAAQSLMPQVSSVGQNGDLSSLAHTTGIQSQFFSPVADDNANRGRPLCVVGTPATYPGYLLIADPDISIACTASEQQTIKGYMSSGFFYE